MSFCLKHNQTYSVEAHEYCIYCGNPYTVISQTATNYKCYGYCHKAKEGEIFTCGCPCHHDKIK